MRDMVLGCVDMKGVLCGFWRDDMYGRPREEEGARGYAHVHVVVIPLPLPLSSAHAFGAAYVTRNASMLLLHRS